MKTIEIVSNRKAKFLVFIGENPHPLYGAGVRHIKDLLEEEGVKVSTHSLRYGCRDLKHGQNEVYVGQGIRLVKC